MIPPPRFNYRKLRKSFKLSPIPMTKVGRRIEPRAAILLALSLARRLSCDTNPAASCLHFSFKLAAHKPALIHPKIKAKQTSQQKHQQTATKHRPTSMPMPRPIAIAIPICDLRLPLRAAPLEQIKFQIVFHGPTDSSH